MTDKEYRELYKTHVNFSFLKKFYVNPFKALYEKEHPVETDAMRLGTAFHKLVLEGGKDLAIMPNLDRRKKDDKETYDQFMVDNANKTIVKQVEFESIENMNKSVQADIQRLGFKNQYEAEKVFTGDIEGVKCCCRIDMFSPIFIGDLKSASCADFHSFKWCIKKMFYVEQLVFYSLIASVSDIPLYLFAVEKEPPYFSQVYRLERDLKDLAYNRLMNMIKEYNLYIDDPDGYLDARHDCIYIDEI